MLGYESATAVDESLDALRHPKRRRLLFALLEETEASGIDAQCTIASVFDEQDAESHIELIHVHLPKLDERGFVDWQMSDPTVEPGPRWGDIEPILSVLYNHLNELPPTLRGTPSARSEASK